MCRQLYMCPDTRSSTCASIVNCLQLLLQLFSQLCSTVVLILLPAYVYVSAYYYMCPHTTTFLVSSFYYIFVLIFVLILLHMCPHTTASVSSYYYMCPHTTICVFILLFMCLHTTIYVSSCYYMCPHTTTSVSSYYYMCPHTTPHRSAVTSAGSTCPSINQLERQIEETPQAP